MKVFNEMGKPQETKADKDSAFMCVAWVQIQVTTSINGISDIERFHKSENEKLRIIGSEWDIENRYTKFFTFTITKQNKMLQIKYQLTYLCMQELLIMTHKKGN